MQIDGLVLGGGVGDEDDELHPLLDAEGHVYLGVGASGRRYPALIVLLVLDDHALMSLDGTSVGQIAGAVTLSHGVAFIGVDEVVESGVVGVDPDELVGEQDVPHAVPVGLQLKGGVEARGGRGAVIGDIGGKVDPGGISRRERIVSGTHGLHAEANVAVSGTGGAGGHEVEGVTREGIRGIGPQADVQPVPRGQVKIVLVDDVVHRASDGDGGVVHPDAADQCLGIDEISAVPVGELYDLVDGAAGVLADPQRVIGGSDRVVGDGEGTVVRTGGVGRQDGDEEHDRDDHRRSSCTESGSSRLLTSSI
ncbi:MAG: hypothetical protein II848_05965 [Candidatus Methanomethylophilus sp.]|nr:hypothetical protein [Methanomethylophilus sp.]